jgi:hypothetical protein
MSTPGMQADRRHPEARPAMRLLNPLFALIAAATDSHLARMVEYLKAETARA